MIEFSLKLEPFFPSAWLLRPVPAAAADSVTECTVDSCSRSRNRAGKVGFRGENPIVGQQQLGLVTYFTAPSETPPQHRHAHRWTGGRLLHWEDLSCQVGRVIRSNNLAAAIAKVSKLVSCDNSI